MDITPHNLLFELQYKLSFLKSEILENKIRLQAKSNTYIDYVINEVKIQITDKSLDGKIIVNRWLDLFKVNIEDVLSFKYENEEFKNYFTTEYLNLPIETIERNKYLEFRVKFKEYLCVYYAREIISYCKIKPTKTSIPSDKNKSMKTTILKEFSYNISKYDDLTKVYDFYNFYDSNILCLCESLKDEITENLLTLDSTKHTIYLDLVYETLEKSPFYNINPIIIDQYLTEYNINIEQFPNFENDKLIRLLKTNDYYNQLPYNEFSYIENIQEAFYKYFAMIETKKLLEHTKQLKVKYTIPNSHKNLAPNKIRWCGKPSQLGFIMGMLANLDYIESPKRQNGETNFTQFAKDLLEIIEIETTIGSLSTYLNIDSSKAQETVRKFENEKFHIPNRKMIS